MNSEQLKRLMRLSQRSGTPLIISEGEEAMVILDVDHYEALLGLPSGLDEEYASVGYEEELEMDDPALEVMPPTVDPSPSAEQREPLPKDSLQHPAAPVEVEEEEGLPNVVSALEDDPFAGEEEQFYLEPID